MDKTFFIMMYTQNGKSAMPMITYDEQENEHVAFFETEAEARSNAEEHPFARNFGYEIFDMSAGL